MYGNLGQSYGQLQQGLSISPRVVLHNGCPQVLLG